MRALNVAILGATGMVGQELLDILVEREFPIKTSHCYHHLVPPVPAF